MKIWFQSVLFASGEDKVSDFFSISFDDLPGHPCLWNIDFLFGRVQINKLVRIHYIVFASVRKAGSWRFVASGVAFIQGACSSRGL